jgi:hypothetical protein
VGFGKALGVSDRKQKAEDCNDFITPPGHPGCYVSQDGLLGGPSEGEGEAADYRMPTSWSMLCAYAIERRQFCPELWTNSSGNQRTLIEMDAVVHAARRGRSARKMVQEPEQVEALSSRTLTVTPSVPDPAQSAENVREFCVPGTPDHPADLI